MWRRRRRQRQVGGPVGTEAVAQDNIKRNARLFSYPKCGFVSPIEHSLLYAMLSDPKHYPEEVVKDAIDDVDFTEYLAVNTASSNAPSNDDNLVSYKQLSALLALSAEKLPPKEDNDQTSQEKISSQEKLCKKFLKCVVRYADEHELDRATEVEELLRPVKLVAQRNESKAALSAILPFYVGYAASLVTLNPLPMFVGATMTVMSDSNDGERQNVQKFAGEAARKSDMEKASLLDETDDI